MTVGATWKTAMGVGLVILGVGVANYAGVNRSLAEVISGDPRNSGVEIYAHYRFFVVPSDIVVDLRAVPSNVSQADMFRILLQFAASEKDAERERVYLAYRGENRLVVPGSYFRELGDGYSSQNPVYTMRTFPSHLQNLDGSQAYRTWHGGLLGVLGKQMEDFQDFHRRWYLDDVLGGMKPDEL